MKSVKMSKALTVRLQQGLFNLFLRQKIYLQKQISKKALFDLVRRFQGIYEERSGCFSSQTLQDIRFRRILKTEKSGRKIQTL